LTDPRLYGWTPVSLLSVKPFKNFLGIKIYLDCQSRFSNSHSAKIFTGKLPV
jgi:hypothetical protein